VLKDTGYIELRRVHGQIHCFENHGHYGAAETRLMAMARSPTALELLRMALREPGIAPAEVAHRLRMARSSVKHHVDRLVAEGVLEARRVGPRVELHVPVSVVDPLVRLLDRPSLDAGAVRSFA
jgi:DNA-binding transcriptional ArsR family regulator